MAQKDVVKTVELVKISGNQAFSKSLWLARGGFKDGRCKMANLRGVSDIKGHVKIIGRGERLDLRSRIILNSARFRGRWSWGSESSVRWGGSSRMRSELVSMNTEVVRIKNSIIKTLMAKYVEGNHVGGEYGEGKHGEV